MWLRALASAAGLALLAGLGLLAPTSTSSSASPQSPVEARGVSHALLVGCTDYPNLSERYQLRGPANDVKLLREVLEKRFGFLAANIKTLAEDEGEENRPTRAHIQREFDRLTRIARPGDQIVILLGGHGSQQPDQFPPDPDDPEPDGLDETFLPCDVGAWDKQKQVVTNAIIDDELRAWTKKILAKGASLFVIVDACHSGTVLRDASDEVEREVPAGTLVPQDALDLARKRAAEFYGQQRGDGAPEESPFKMAREGSLVALYAAQSTEPTVERPMPPDGTVTKRHGLLTYAVCQLLMESKTPLTYRELGQRVYAQYVQWHRTSPTPLIEGVDLDREVLGRRQWPGRSRFTLVPSGDGWKVTGGALHGLTEGSILAVYPPAGAADADKPLGHVRIRKSDPFEAEVEPCRHAKLDSPKSLPEGGRCEPAYLDYGRMRLRVAVGTVPETERAAPT